jgi:hypothetical protein
MNGILVVCGDINLVKDDIEREANECPFFEALCMMIRLGPLGAHGTSKYQP